MCWQRESEAKVIGPGNFDANLVEVGWRFLVSTLRPFVLEPEAASRGTWGCRQTFHLNRQSSRGDLLWPTRAAQRALRIILFTRCSSPSRLRSLLRPSSAT